MDKIQFSIIMPNYNKSQYLSFSIESVLEQTYPFFELIIIDDGSLDDSVRIIESYKDSRIMLIKQENSGAAAARNNGIKNARFNFVAFLDSDDIWLPHFLEKMVSLINSFPDAGAYSCAFFKEKIDADNLKKYDRIKCLDSKDYIIDNYYDSVLNGTEAMTASTTVVRKTVFELCGLFPVGLKNWEDFDMWIRIALYSKVCYTTCICAVYNDVPNSASRNRENLHAPVFDDYRYHIRKSGISGEQKKSFVRLVAQKKGHAAYEQYLIDRNGWKAVKEVIPFVYVRFRDKTYWSSMIQFLITPERVFGILNKLGRAR